MNWILKDYSSTHWNVVNQLISPKASGAFKRVTVIFCTLIELIISECTDAVYGIAYIWAFYPCIEWSNLITNNFIAASLSFAHSHIQSIEYQLCRVYIYFTERHEQNKSFIHTTVRNEFNSNWIVFMTNGLTSINDDNQNRTIHATATCSV